MKCKNCMVKCKETLYLPGDKKEHSKECPVFTPYPLKLCQIHDIFYRENKGCSECQDDDWDNLTSVDGLIEVPEAEL